MTYLGAAVGTVEAKELHDEGCVMKVYGVGLCICVCPGVIGQVLQQSKSEASKDSRVDVTSKKDEESRISGLQNVC